MFEIIMAIAAVVVIWRMAEEDRGEGLKWGAITLGLCLFSFLIPLPFLRMIVACGLAFVLMTVSKKTYY